MNRHPWVTAGSKGELELEAPMMEVVQTHIIPSEEFIDDDVLRAMNSLGCFKDKEKLKQELLKPLHNTGKTTIAIYTSMAQSRLVSRETRLRFARLVSRDLGARVSQKFSPK